ncbi:MAG: hypothetical protein JNM12_06880 [Alphaproteobacteria bacterium]|nr:hypothetical protein [Alphaproteobacteria bacterium]
MNNKALLASVALNVFLAAFVLGRMSVLPPSMPAPAFTKGDQRNGPPPPPMFGPQELFGADEMKEHFKEIEGRFEKVQALRKEFAQTLMQGKVTEEQAAQHLAAIDAEMDGVKKSVQGKAAKKIADLPDDKRLEFAKRLMEKAPPPPDGRNGPAGFGGPPPHSGPDGDFRGPPPDGERGPPPDDKRGPPPDRAPPPQQGQIPGDFDPGTPPQ